MNFSKFLTIIMRIAETYLKIKLIFKALLSQSIRENSPHSKLKCFFMGLSLGNYN